MLLINTIIKEFKKIIPEYTNNLEDFAVSNGNVALCIITEDGDIYGKLFGDDKIKQRFFYQIAWSKASQANITNTPTGEFERLVFNDELNEKPFGIKRHDFVGWKGGTPVTINGIKLAIGFSGFRESSDIEITTRVLAELL